MLHLSKTGQCSVRRHGLCNGFLQGLVGFRLIIIAACNEPFNLKKITRDSFDIVNQKKMDPNLMPSKIAMLAKYQIVKTSFTYDCSNGEKKIEQNYGFSLYFVSIRKQNGKKPTNYICITIR